jgi:hypothetical protein
VTSEFVSVRIRSESIPGGVCVCSVHAACMPHTRVHVTSNQGRLKKTINATFHPFDLQTPAPVGHHYQLTSPCFSHLGAAALACSSAPHISAPTSPPQITALTSPVSAPRQLNLLPPHSMSAPRYMAPRPVTSTPRSRSIFRNLFKRGVFVNFFPKGQKRKKRSSLVVGMPAGRALPQARWTNPHRIPASGRNSARITNAAPCGQPVSAGGAANPARQRIVERERSKLPIGKKGIVSPPSSCVRRARVPTSSPSARLARQHVTTTGYRRIHHPFQLNAAFLSLMPSSCPQIC